MPQSVAATHPSHLGRLSMPAGTPAAASASLTTGSLIYHLLVGHSCNVSHGIPHLNVSLGYQSTLLTIEGVLEVKECHHTLQAFQGEDGCTALPRHPGILWWTSQTVGGQLAAQSANLKPSLQQLSQSLATSWHPVALGLHQAYIL